MIWLIWLNKRIYFLLKREKFTIVFRELRHYENSMVNENYQDNWKWHLRQFGCNGWKLLLKQRCACRTSRSIFIVKCYERWSVDLFQMLTKEKQTLNQTICFGTYFSSRHMMHMLAGGVNVWLRLWMSAGCKICHLF